MKHSFKLIYRVDCFSIILWLPFLGNEEFLVKLYLQVHVPPLSKQYRVVRMCISFYNMVDMFGSLLTKSYSVIIKEWHCLQCKYSTCLVWIKGSTILRYLLYCCVYVRLGCYSCKNKETYSLPWK